MTARVALTPATAVRWHSLLSRLTLIARKYPNTVLASSLAAEDMVLTHAIFSERLPIEVFTLDTGRLHAETLQMLRTIRQHYGRNIAVYQPAPDQVDEYVTRYGEFAFYESIELRKACCHIRKVVPLQNALKGRDAWITGQRRSQAATRADLPEEEHDAAFGLYKFNPLAAWNEDDVWNVIRAMNVPYNPLHDQGYPSIGCEPCTRPIRRGEDPRAGRWWWESSDLKECGLHVANEGRSHSEAITRPRAMMPGAG